RFPVLRQGRRSYQGNCPVASPPCRTELELLPDIPVLRQGRRSYQGNCRWLGGDAEATRGIAGGFGLRAEPSLTFRSSAGTPKLPRSVQPLRITPQALTERHLRLPPQQSLGLRRVRGGQRHV